MSFDQILRAAIDEAELAQTTVAERTGITATMLTRYVKGRSLPGDKTYARLREVLPTLPEKPPERRAPKAGELRNKGEMRIEIKDGGVCLLSFQAVEITLEQVGQIMNILGEENS